MGLRVYLTGRVVLEVDGRFIDQDEFPGRQGRVALAYLVLERRGALLRDELANQLWPEALPNAWANGLSALISKLRSLLSTLELSGSDVLASSGSEYKVTLPEGSWVDVEAGLAALHEAEGTLASGDPRAAYGPSQVAYHITRRPFLPGEDGPWIRRQRERLREAALRSMECVAAIYLAVGDPNGAVGVAQEALGLDQFRETAYRLLISAYVAQGNRAEALRTYERCRRLISDELGADPSPETQALHLSVLTA